MTRINKLKSIEKVIKETDNKIDKLSSKIDKVLHLNQVQLEKEN